jgi:hypothetical protein
MHSPYIGCFLLLAFSFAVIHHIMKPFSSTWDQFIPLHANGNVIFDKRKAVKARCKHCDWERAANTTRMQGHFKTSHEAHESSEGALPPSSEVRWCLFFFALKLFILGRNFNRDPPSQ